MKQIPWERILDIAKNAPSGGNTQPWAVEINQNSLVASITEEVTHAPTYEYLAAFVSLGALSHNITQVAEAFGYQTEVEIVETTPPQVSIKIMGHVDTHLDSAILDTITQRCTNRKPTLNTISSTIMSQFESGLTHFLSHNHLSFLSLARVRDKAKLQQVVDILSKAEMLRFSYQPTKKSVFEEIKCHEADSVEKIALKTLELPWLVEKMMCLMIHHPKLRSLLSPRLVGAIVKSQLIKSADIACFYCAAPPTLVQLIQLGQAIQFFWLTLTQNHLSMQPWSSLPFYHLEPYYDRPLTLPSKEQAEIGLLVEQLNKVFEKENKLPLFIFRMHDAPPPVHRSGKKSLMPTASGLQE